MITKEGTSRQGCKPFLPSSGQIRSSCRRPCAEAKASLRPPPPGCFRVIGSRSRTAQVEASDQQTETLINQQPNVREQTCGWMITGTVVSQLIKVQILILAFISRFISGFPVIHIQWEETFPSTTRCLRQLHKFQDDMPAQPFGNAHRSSIYVCAFIEMSVCTCI